MSGKKDFSTLKLAIKASKNRESFDPSKAGDTELPPVDSSDPKQRDHYWKIHNVDRWIVTVIILLFLLHSSLTKSTLVSTHMINTNASNRTHTTPGLVCLHHNRSWKVA